VKVIFPVFFPSRKTKEESAKTKEVCKKEGKKHCCQKKEGKCECTFTLSFRTLLLQGKKTGLCSHF
jgi:hypothetical protein